MRLAVGVGAETYDLVGMKRMGNRVTQVANLLPSLTAAVPRRPSPWSGVLRRALLPEGLSALHRECSAMAHPLGHMALPLPIIWVALLAQQPVGVRLQLVQAPPVGYPVLAGSTEGDEEELRGYGRWGQL